MIVESKTSEVKDWLLEKSITLYFLSGDSQWIKKSKKFTFRDEITKLDKKEAGTSLVFQLPGL